MFRPRLVPTFFVLAIATGCSTSAPSTGTTENLLSSSGSELQQAQRLIDQGRYYQAIPPLHQAIMKAPESETGFDARYLLGVTYSEIANTKDAIDVLADYLNVAPEGRYAQEAGQLLARLRNQYARQFPTTDALDEEVERLEHLVREDDSIAARLALADAYWRRGNYTQAGEIYAHAVAERRELSGNSAILTRMDFRPDGSYVILTPAEIQRREVARRPVVIHNESAFRARRDTFTGVPRLYVVTGQVTNRSDSVLYGVEINCTLYGFGNRVFDTSVAPVGRMYPGETRAYSVQFANFDDINNIRRHECVVGFR